jgi:tetratricopeptide (TPR) repeat protein
VSAASPKHVELPPVVVPPHLWARSERPVAGRAIQIAIPGAFVIAGLAAPTTAARIGLITSALILAFLVPGLVQYALEGLGAKVTAARRSTAAELRRGLRGRLFVRLFAPAAWTALQEAQLALRLGDGQTAANGYAETARLCKRPDAVMLISAQAHALVVAGDRKAAREFLDKLAAAKLLGPRDQLDLGIVMLLESHKRSRQAMAYIEAARKTIGDHPRVIAAMALGLQRAERIDEAAALLERAQISQQEEPDPLVEELITRARRDMRRYIEAQLRRERRARSRRTTVVVTSEHAVSEVVSGEIASRGDSGAVPRASDAEEQADISAAVADALSDSEALRARGWLDPSNFAGKAPDDAQPKVKIELRDPSLGAPIRLEKSYSLKPKREPVKRLTPGPAIDIDLALDDGGDEDSAGAEDTEAGGAPAAAQSSGHSPAPGALLAPPADAKPDSLTAAIGQIVAPAPAPAPEAPRPRVTLVESIADAISALGPAVQPARSVGDPSPAPGALTTPVQPARSSADGASPAPGALRAPLPSRSADNASPPPGAVTPPLEADAPMTLRRSGRTTLITAAVINPGDRPAARTFAAPPGKPAPASPAAFQPAAGKKPDPKK